MKRLDYADEVINKMLIKITEFNEDLYILIDLEKVRILIRDYFDT